MDLLFSHDQEKKEKGFNQSRCNLKLYHNDDGIVYTASFDLDYRRYGEKRHITFEHQLTIYTKTGDIEVLYKIINEGITQEEMFRNIVKNKKNDFKLLLDLTESGFINGEKKMGYWGVKYERAIEKIYNTIYGILHQKLKSNYYKEKNYKDKYVVNQLFDLLVDFHLDKKGIKGHNSVYLNIQTEYPKKKWLEKNDYKFLPSILDNYGIKSKYLVGELNEIHNKPIQISSINYVCKLFGENYIDYLKKVPWKEHCYDIPPNKKIHPLKSENEKKFMVEIMNKWEKDKIYGDSFIYSINKLLSIRDHLEPLGYILKFDAKNDREFENISEMWNGYKTHLTRGYKLKYVIDPNFQSFIEEDIIIDSEVFKPKLLLTEEQYRMEGYIMKNCMAKQFTHGAVYLYVSLQNKRKRINLQYHKGGMVQSFGRANITTPEIFYDAIMILNSRFGYFPAIEWQRMKYDFIQKMK